MCPVVLELQKREEFNCIVCLTGQHRDMLLPVMQLFDIQDDYNLDIMTDGQTLFSITEKLLIKMQFILEQENPDIVLVHGDTTSAFVAALACFYKHIPIGHVEAGLRTYDLEAPFPEEFNRQVVDMLSQICFAPTANARKNLLDDHIPENNIVITGNTVIDALRMTVHSDFKDENLEWADHGRLLLMTAHRRENWGEPLRHICRAIRRIADCYEDVRIIYPVHRNPYVRDTVMGELADHPRIRLIEPLEADVFHNYIKQAYLVLTDSGGIQEEAPSLGTPVLVLRDTTERPEGVDAGTLLLVGTVEENIFNSCLQLLEDKEKYDCMSKAVNPYGDGKAAQRIADALMMWSSNKGK